MSDGIILVHPAALKKAMVNHALGEEKNKHRQHNDKQKLCQSCPAQSPFFGIGRTPRNSHRNRLFSAYDAGAPGCYFESSQAPKAAAVEPQSLRAGFRLSFSTCTKDDTRMQVMQAFFAQFSKMSWVLAGCDPTESRDRRQGKKAAVGQT